MNDKGSSALPDPGLIRYWFEFEYEPGSAGSYRGPICAGVTAFDLDDAVSLLLAAFFVDEAMPAISRLVENVDVSTIKFPTKAYRRINYLPPIWRGVWYPMRGSISPTP